MGAHNVIAILLSLAAGPCFQAPVLYGSSADQAVLVRDLDGDGAPDIIASGNHVEEASVFSVLRNRGDGSFEAERLFETRFGETLYDIGNLDNDRAPDLVASDYWSNGIVVHRGDDATFYETATHGGPSFIVDYDHDGKADVVSLSYGSGNPVRLHLFHGNGDGTFAPKTTFDTQLANAASPSIRTINGALEILVNERSHNLGLIHYAAGQITVSRIAIGPAFDLTSTFADVDGDGIADIVATDNAPSVFVMLGNADGTFRERRQLNTPAITQLAAVHAADLDGDGHLDIVVSDFRTPNLYLFRGENDPIAINAGGPVNAFAIADVNGDGRLDIVTANNDHTVSVVRNAPCDSRRRAARH